MTEFCCKWNFILWLRLSTSRTKTDINGGRALYATGHEEDRWGDTLSAYSLNLMLQLSGLKYERWSRSEKFTLCFILRCTCMHIAVTVHYFIVCSHIPHSVDVLSSLLWGRIPLMVRCTRYNTMWSSGLWQVGGFLWLLRFPSPI
jgi:hypothetical protein